MRRKLWLAMALSPVLMASTCMEPVHVRVDPGPRPEDAPAFHFIYDGDAVTYVEEFQVAKCRSAGTRAPMWRIVRDGQTPTDIEPLRIVYGQVPRGYRETTAPQPLDPGGCYRASVDYLAPVGRPIRHPAGVETFRLLANRQVIAGGPAGLIHNTRPFRQLNRAAVACTRGYRRADTAADSAAVSAREYAVLDARVSCDWLYSEWPDLMEEPLSTERASLAMAVLLAVYVGLGLLLEQIPDGVQ